MFSLYIRKLTFINKKAIYKSSTVLCKNMLSDMFWVFQKKKKSFINKSVSKKTTMWRLKKSHSNDKLWEKITSSSYHMEQKTFIASCIYNIHTEESHFCSCYLWRFVSRLDSDRSKNLKCTLVCTSLLLLL